MHSLTPYKKHIGQYVRHEIHSYVLRLANDRICESLFLEKNIGVTIFMLIHTDYDVFGICLAEVLILFKANLN